MILHPANGPRFILPLINNYFGNIISNIINSFKARVSADSGTYEADSCLNSIITNLRNIDLA